MNSREKPEQTESRGRVLTTAAVYFVVVFAVGMVLGPVRVLWLEPMLGPALAVLVETPFLIGAMAVGAWLAPRMTGLSAGWLSHLGVGLLALLFQQMADLGVGFGLRGMNLAQQLAHFATPAGWIYAFNLLVFALMPAGLRFARTRRPAQAPDTPPPCATE